MERKIKKSLICKEVSNFYFNRQIIAEHQPKAGDVGIFQVLTDASAYIMNERGIASKIMPGDRLMLAFGNRYATNQFEGYVPKHPTMICQLLGRGGVAGVLTGQNATFKQIPVDLELLGYACDLNTGDVLNTIQHEKLDRFDPASVRSKVILSVGSSMDSGKTTSAAYLCNGLSSAGKKVAYVKLTGTVFPKDAQLNLDLGADYVVDFSRFGFPSTYLCSEQTLLDLYQSLLNLACQAAEAEYVVLEIADGLLQRETALLLQNQAFLSTVHGVLLSCGDSLGVLSGLQLLKEWNCAPFAVSGLFTASELLVKEVKSMVTNTPILNLSELSNCKGVELLENLSAESPYLIEATKEGKRLKAA
ncbi:MAG: hypothetical protein HUU34_07835 [Saprospiraceae bacterium]|nr:hypothetical protein [Saprospiraceae bacterium]